jgi:hypothetical protein
MFGPKADVARKKKGNKKVAFFTLTLKAMSNALVDISFKGIAGSKDT